jgi:hypothetical protein
VWEVAKAVPWAREFSAFTPRSLRSVLAETSAHLMRLAADGWIRRVPGRPERWAPEQQPSTR